MRKLTKKSIPEDLKNNLLTWKTQFEALLLIGAEIPKELSIKYKHPQVKFFIEQETQFKCAYCESKFMHTSYGEVEHIIPKSARPDLRYEYDNLTLTCSICNNSKNSYLDKNYSIINPYQQNPGSYIYPAGPVMMRRLGKDMGEMTIKVLDLNRTTLVEERSERIKYIELLVEKWQSMKDGSAKELLKAEIIAESGSDRKYSLTILIYLKSINFISP